MPLAGGCPLSCPDGGQAWGSRGSQTLKRRREESTVVETAGSCISSRRCTPPSPSLGAGNAPRFFSFSYRNPSWHCLLRSLSLPLPLSGTQASETSLGPKVIKGHSGFISLCIQPRCSACSPTLFSLAVAKICSSHFVKDLSLTLGGSYGCGDAYPLCSRSVSQESRIQLRRES